MRTLYYELVSDMDSDSSDVDLDHATVVDVYPRPPPLERMSVVVPVVEREISPIRWEFDDRPVSSRTRFAAYRHVHRARNFIHTYTRSIDEIWGYDCASGKVLVSFETTLFEETAYYDLATLNQLKEWFGCHWRIDHLRDRGMIYWDDAWVRLSDELNPEDYMTFVSYLKRSSGPPYMDVVTYEQHTTKDPRVRMVCCNQLMHPSTIIKDMQIRFNNYEDADQFTYKCPYCRKVYQ